MLVLSLGSFLSHFGVVFEPLFTYTEKIRKKGSNLAPDGYFIMVITLWSGIPLPNNIINASGAVWEPIKQFFFNKTNFNLYRL